MRQKKPLEGTVLKYIDFLQEIHTYSYPEKSYYTIHEVITKTQINKSILRALIKLDIITLVDDLTWNWLLKEPTRELALEVLNYLLEKGKKQIVTPIIGLDSETRAYVKEIRDLMISNSQNKSDASQGLKSGLLAKAFNQSEISPNNHLFSKVESDKNKKFELLKAVAGGWFAQSDFITPYQQINDTILLATEDLFNKFFKK